MTDARDIWPAAERNKGPILAALRRLWPAEPARVLEVSSGSGQHAAHFATELPVQRYQPTEMDEAHHPSITAWTADIEGVEPVLRLDTTEDPWPIGDRTFDVIYNANMIHIAPWAACQGLLRGAARHLSPTGLLVMYGPYKLDGAHTAPSNAAFDESLQARNPSWGVRDLADVTREAESHGLTFRERIPMPANNQIVVFTRS